MVPQQQIFLGRQCYLLARQVDLHPSHCVSLSLSFFLNLCFNLVSYRIYVPRALNRWTATRTYRMACSVSGALPSTKFTFDPVLSMGLSAE